MKTGIETKKRNHKQRKIEYLEAKIKVLETENSMLKNAAVDKVFG